MYYEPDLWWTGIGIPELIIGNVAAIIALSYIAAHYVSTAVIFTKADEAPWKSLIPFYDMYTYFKAFWDVKMFIPYILAVAGGYIGIVLCVNSSLDYVYAYYLNISPRPSAIVGIIVCIICRIICIVFSVLLKYHISKKFGKGGGYTVGLVFLNLIFKMMLAFGDAKLQKSIQQSATGTGSIRVLSGDLRGKSISIPPGEVVSIGRIPNMVSLAVDTGNQNSKVSRKHCEIEFNAELDTYYVIDVSSNGTSLADGTRLIRGARTPVRRGTEVILPDNNKFILE